MAGQDQTFQGICPPCHQLKTSQENKTLTIDFMASQFEKNTWESYVASPRPPPMVYQLKTPDEKAALEIADVVRCRKRGLEYNQYEILVFSPLDDIEEMHDHVLGDVCFVNKAQRKLSATLDLT